MHGLVAEWARASIYALNHSDEHIEQAGSRHAETIRCQMSGAAKHLIAVVPVIGKSKAYSTMLRYGRVKDSVANKFARLALKENAVLVKAEGDAFIIGQRLLFIWSVL
jgi:hypothetical protein